ncbi:hypothetical protein [Solimonas sp. K1W22B-7]|uniref:hypothetical protein n=1 Tax=Solimonas sp. K1W22B-7 TaxID=2303331 RepID=UPI0013C51330|nr:hypothetical protein [Solimonas sp. K1W22B-7]
MSTPCYEEPAAGSALQQGDILHWPKAANCFEAAGVVVTADCDLARGKHWGKVSVVPLISMQNCVEELMAPKLLERCTDKLFEKLKKQLRKKFGGEEISKDILEIHLSSEKIPDEWRDDAEIDTLAKLVRQARRHESTIPPLECLAMAYKQLEAKPNSVLLNKIQTALQQPPGDVLVLPLISLLPFEARVAWLRVLREVEDIQVALKASEYTDGMAQRVARLGPIWRYKLTQKLAQVFSDIGLPDEDEATVKTDIVSYGQQLSHQYTPEGV